MKMDPIEKFIVYFFCGIILLLAVHCYRHPDDIFTKPTAQEKARETSK